MLGNFFTYINSGRYYNLRDQVSNKDDMSEAEEMMAQQLRAPTALIEGLRTVPSTSVRQLNHL